jgi:phenylpropionate dioxygenase-like ring-hydroxylating dioxygenase large terminal subunit
MSDVCPHRFAPLHQGVRQGDVVNCPYHGLGFDSTGACVHNPHGTGRIPSNANLKTFPIVERQGAVWIWMGDVSLADPSAIIDLNFVGLEEYPAVTGYYRPKVEYRLVIDNLLDLNHAPYLHAGTLSPIGATRETTAAKGANTAASHYVMRSVETPASQKIWYPAPRGDYYVTIDWTAPSSLRQSIGMTGEGLPVSEGAIMRVAHLLTPETETSTHYFWGVTRNRHRDDRNADLAIRTIIETAFGAEDGPMMESVQDNMQGRDFDAMKPVFLETDAAAGHARAVLKRLLAAQS